MRKSEAGLIHYADDVYTEYPDPDCDEWALRILPWLKEQKLSDLVELTGISERQLKYLRAGKSRPHPRNLKRLREIIPAVWTNREEPI